MKFSKRRHNHPYAMRQDHNWFFQCADFAPRCALQGFDVYWKMGGRQQHHSYAMRRTEPEQMLR